MYNAFALPATIAGRDLAEFGAKMQSWPEISACEVDTGIFQGADATPCTCSSSGAAPALYLPD